MRSAFFSKEYLEKLKRAIVTNSLNIVKLKMAANDKEKLAKMYAVVDFEKSLHNCPVLDLKSK